MGAVVTWLAVFLAIEFCHHFLGSADAEFGEVYGVGTHISNVSVLVKVLCHHHGLRNRKTQFACSFLLKCGCSERRSRLSVEWLLRDSLDGKLCIAAFFKESDRLFMSVESMVELSMKLAHIAICVRKGKDGSHAVVRFWLESLHFTLTFHYKTSGNALHTSSREQWLDLSPEHRREIEAHQPVEHAACLLRIGKVHIEVTRMLYSVKYGVLGNLMEDDTACLLLIQSEHFTQMP